MSFSFRPLDKSAYQIFFSYFATNTYVVGTQKNRLNETVLLSNKTYAKNYEKENIHNFTLKVFVYINLWFIDVFRVPFNV